MRFKSKSFFHLNLSILRNGTFIIETQNKSRDRQKTQGIAGETPDITTGTQYRARAPPGLPGGAGGTKKPEVVTGDHTIESG
jgi:hypothetical protein